MKNSKLLTRALIEICNSYIKSEESPCSSLTHLISAYNIIYYMLDQQELNLEPQYEEIHKLFTEDLNTEYHYPSLPKLVDVITESNTTNNELL